MHFNDVAIFQEMTLPMRLLIFAEMRPRFQAIPQLRLKKTQAGEAVDALVQAVLVEIRVCYLLQHIVCLLFSQCRLAFIRPVNL